ncbi:hypothetical protein GC093_18370 [Paenibacillus sp. LMG 31456]|uniref:Uncharacterized protein n=1 Tax=Paenibacillus foliorum TaxID=2654974 RepID=A0A972GRR1_9BACL|nr:hypothetical protein [Paenibacillus foliorum]NOU95173.1 hypothetical protein [Paenibacillus foliorum]
MIERYQLLNEPGRTICIFEKSGKYFGHILKDRTDKAPAKLVFETPRYDSLDALKAEYPSMA